jgi:2'-5' RNA ligase
MTGPTPGPSTGPPEGGQRRLFVAVRPPPTVVERLERLPFRVGPGARWVDPVTWHVTLRFLGTARPEAVIAALDRSPPGPAAAVRLGPFVEMLGRAVVVPVAGLDELAAAVATATAHLVPADERPFVGHLTRGRLGPGASPGPPVGHAVGGGFVADVVELVASEPGPSGHRHEVLHTWRL